MSTQAFEQARIAPSPVALASWSTIIGGIVTFALGFPLAPFQAQDPPPVWIPALNALSHLLIIGGLLGLARGGAAGRGWLASTGIGVSLLGFAILTVAEFVWLALPSASDALFSAASLAMMLGLILLGIAVVRARRWSGWHRFIPLACGLYIPLVMGPAFALPGYAAHYAIGVWGICWLLLGLALRSEGSRQG